MGRRLELHEILCEALGSRQVYYQPPATVRMKYPAIVYSREDIDNDFADDLVYRQSHSYLVTVVGHDPDSEIIDRVSRLRSCRYNRHYVADNLNHDAFIINY